MKSYKKIVSFGSLLLGMMLFAPLVDAATISGNVSLLNETHVTQATRLNPITGKVNTIGFASYSGINSKNLINASVSLLDENGVVLQTVKTDSEGNYQFDVPNGNYKISYTDENTTILSVTIPYFLTNTMPQLNQTTGVLTVQDNNISGINWFVVPKLYEIRLETSPGTFDGSANGLYLSYAGVIYRNNQGYNFVGGSSEFGLLGVPHGYSMSNLTYSGFRSSDVPLPQLSDEETAYGYRFIGWVPNGNREKIYTTDEMMGYAILEDTVWSAVFEVPKHVVTFATDTSKGTIDGNNIRNIEIQGNTHVLTADEIPVPEAKEGYTFVGWYEDETTNLVDVTATPITTTRAYYAKYEQASEKTAIPVISVLVEGDQVVKGKGIPQATITAVLPDGSVVTTVVDENGEWSVPLPAPAEKGSHVTVQQRENGKLTSDTASGTAIPVIVNGQTYTVETVDYTDPSSGRTGILVIVRDGNGTIVSQTPIFNGQDGQDGKMD